MHRALFQQLELVTLRVVPQTEECCQSVVLDLYYSAIIAIEKINENTRKLQIADQSLEILNT